MKRLAGITAIGGAALAGLSMILAPALSASMQNDTRERRAPSLNAGGFTPAVADPRLAAEFARRGFQPGSFRFTPSSASPDKSKAVRVAVRATSLPAVQALSQTPAASSVATVTAITPTAYNLGVSVGWKRFALSGDVARVQGGPLPGGRESAEVGVSYAGNKFTGRLQLGAERTDGSRPVTIGEESSYSLDVGGSYSIARNLDLTGGVRYRIQNDRLATLAEDRRDSQAVYIGTAFRF